MPNDKFLPYYIPDIGQEEIREVVKVLKSGWLTLGPKTVQFEEECRKYIGAENAIAVNSCTNGLHVALVALGVGPGDEVITTPFTFPATAHVIEHVGARVVFADIKRDSYNIDPDEIAKKITKKTKAIIPVHYSGNAAALDEIYAIAREHDLFVIEDAAHAIGATYKGKKLGSFNSIACFSFYATKNITTGEGGLVTLNDQKLAEKIRMLTLHGISKDAWKRYTASGSWRYEVLYPGFKYNFTDIQAALGLVQLKKIGLFLEKRRWIAKLYNQLLDNMDGIKIPYIPKNDEPIWHLYVIEVEEKSGVSRDEFIDRLHRQGIGTSVHFIPQHMQPYYQKKFNFQPSDFPISYEVFQRVVSLPLYTKMTEDDVSRVAGAIKKVLGK